jgi:hypothetical protein
MSGVPMSDFILNIDWARAGVPRNVGPFQSREEAHEWAVLNIPNGAWEVWPLAHPYAAPIFGGES